jgi:chromosome segregation ATPase
MATTADSLNKIDTQLHRWGEKIDALVAQAEGLGPQVASSLGERIAELRTRRDAAQARLDELRADSHTTWRRARGDMATVWNDLVTAFRALERQARG